jgi:hypothetical protein
VSFTPLARHVHAPIREGVFMKTLAVTAALLLSTIAGCLAESDTDSGHESQSVSELAKAPTCRIDGVTYAAGALDPADSCQSCEPATSKRSWTVTDVACYEPPPPPPPATCESSRDCNGQACIDGLCGACTADSQCGAPLRCDAGVCIP